MKKKTTCDDVKVTLTTGRGQVLEEKFPESDYNI